MNANDRLAPHDQDGRPLMGAREGLLEHAE